MKTLLLAMPLALLPAFYALVPASVAGQVGAASQAPATHASSTVGYVSAQRILIGSTEGKADVARLQSLQQQKATELRAKQQTLDATRQQLAQGGEGSALTQLQQQEQQQRVDLERATAQAQTDLQTLQRQIQNDLQARVKPVVEAVAKRENIDIVLNSDAAVIWATPTLDLTADVIERLNAPAPTAAPKP